MSGEWNGPKKKKLINFVLLWLAIFTVQVVWLLPLWLFIPAGFAVFLLLSFYNQVRHGFYASQGTAYAMPAGRELLPAPIQELFKSGRAFMKAQGFKPAGVIFHLFGEGNFGKHLLYSLAENYYHARSRTRGALNWVVVYLPATGTWISFDLYTSFENRQADCVWMTLNARPVAPVLAKPGGPVLALSKMDSQEELLSLHRERTAGLKFKACPFLKDVQRELNRDPLLPQLVQQGIYEPTSIPGRYRLTRSNALRASLGVYANLRHTRRRMKGAKPFTWKPLP